MLPALRKPIVPHVPIRISPTLSKDEAKGIIQRRLDGYDLHGDPIIGRIWVADTHVSFREGWDSWKWLEHENRYGWQRYPPRYFLKLWTPEEAPPEEHFEQFALTPDEAVTEKNLPWHVTLKDEETAQVLNLRLRECGYRVSFALQRWKTRGNTYLIKLDRGTLGPILLRLESQGRFSPLSRYHISF